MSTDEVVAVGLTLGERVVQGDVHVDGHRLVGGDLHDLDPVAVLVEHVGEPDQHDLVVIHEGQAHRTTLAHRRPRPHPKPPEGVRSFTRWGEYHR